MAASPMSACRCESTAGGSVRIASVGSPMLTCGGDGRRGVVFETFGETEADVLEVESDLLTGRPLMPGAGVVGVLSRALCAP
eukprot:6033104-Pleurochrysis_carterae.AAC.2